MVQLGYAISTEEHAPNDMVRYARLAEDAGFTFSLVSDHFHPWVSEQGHSPFIWSLLGAIAHNTRTLSVGTGVTAPIIRIHPAIIAQAAATVAAMMPGRFFLGVGTGENLNEHILGDRWPAYAVRAEHAEDEVMLSVVLAKGSTLDERGIIEFCKPVMPYFMVPRFVDIVTEFPRTPNSKIEKHKLRAQAEADLTAIWDRERVGLVVTREGISQRQPAAVK